MAFSRRWLLLFPGKFGWFGGLCSMRACNGYCYFPGNRGVLGLYSTCVCKDYCKCPGKWNILGHKKSTPAPEMPFSRGELVFSAPLCCFSPRNVRISRKITVTIANARGMQPPKHSNFPGNNSNHCRQATLQKNVLSPKCYKNR